MIASLRQYAKDVCALPADSVRAWRTAGWEAVWREVRRRTVDPMGGYMRRLVVESDLSRLVETAPPEGLEIRVLNRQDWSLLGDMMRSRLVLQFDEAAAAGHTCLVAWRQRNAVGYAWFVVKMETSRQGFDLPLPVDTLYVWQLNVGPAERWPDTAAALLSGGLRLARERGFHRSWIALDPQNIASIHAVASTAPSRVLGTVTRLKILWWTRSRYRALPSPVPIEATAQ
jgi:hypothetical protein